MTRRVLIIAVLLLGMLIGYLAGCQSRGQSRTMQADPAPGQHWHSQDGDERIVRCVTREGQRTSVWWYRSEAHGADRHCTLTTWRHWARAKGARPE
jgi:hypothetical protein